MSNEIPLFLMDARFTTFMLTLWPLYTRPASPSNVILLYLNIVQLLLQVKWRHPRTSENWKGNQFRRGIEIIPVIIIIIIINIKLETLKWQLAGCILTGCSTGAATLNPNFYKQNLCASVLHPWSVFLRQMRRLCYGFVAEYHHGNKACLRVKLLFKSLPN